MTRSTIQARRKSAELPDKTAKAHIEIDAEEQRAKIARLREQRLAAEAARSGK